MKTRERLVKWLQAWASQAPPYNPPKHKVIRYSERLMILKGSFQLAILLREHRPKVDSKKT